MYDVVYSFASKVYNAYARVIYLQYMRDLEMRAEACLAIAEEALCRPDYMQVHRQKIVPLEDGYDLRLSSNARHVRPNARYSFYGTSDVSKYLYIAYGSAIKFSFDISSLEEGEVGGLTEDIGLLDNARRTTYGETQTQLRFVRRAIAGTFDDVSIQRMNNWFTKMLETGAMQTYSFRTFESDGLEVSTSQFDDSNKLWKPSSYGAPLTISVHAKSDVQATVLDRTPSGLAESYERFLDDRDVIEAAGESDLLRSEDGQVLGLKNQHTIEAKLAEVDRALGRRALSHARLERIEQGTAVMSREMLNDMEEIS